MDFDSSLFDLDFEDLASLSVDTQQQQQPHTGSASPLDFQDFCSEFAGSDFSAGNAAPAWSPAPLPATAGSSVKADISSNASMKAEDLFLDGLDKSVFDPLSPYDSSYEGMFNYNAGSGDAQVVPDMAAGDANAADFTLPTFSQAPLAPPVAPTNLNAGQLPASSQPFSWMNGLDYSSFGWPARARLPSKASL